MRWPLLACLCATVGVAQAQVFYPPVSPSDVQKTVQAALAPYATTASVNTSVAAVPVYTDAQAVAANAAALASVANATVQFVGSGAFMTQANMRTSYACAATYLGKYARVSDMYGTVSSVAICETDGTSYYWRPQRTDYSAVIPQTSGTITLIPFQTAPVVYLPTTPTGNITVALSTTNVWPGATFHVYAPSTVSVSTITIGNLVGGGTVPLLQGSDKILTYTSSGWKSN